MATIAQRNRFEYGVIVGFSIVYLRSKRALLQNRVSPPFSSRKNRSKVEPTKHYLVFYPVRTDTCRKRFPSTYLVCPLRLPEAQAPFEKFQRAPDRLPTSPPAPTLNSVEQKVCLPLASRRIRSQGWGSLIPLAKSQF